MLEEEAREKAEAEELAFWQEQINKGGIFQLEVGDSGTKH